MENKEKQFVIKVLPYGYYAGPNKKYSDMLESEKEIVNKYIQRGYLELEDNDIKINIPVMAMENYKEFCDKAINDLELVNSYKELYNRIYMKVRSLIPNYLEKQTSFIIQSVTLTRSLIITKAFNEGIIEDDKKRKKFIYNYCSQVARLNGINDVVGTAFFDFKITF